MAVPAVLSSCIGHHASCIMASTPWPWCVLLSNSKTGVSHWQMQLAEFFFPESDSPSLQQRLDLPRSVSIVHVYLTSCRIFELQKQGHVHTKKIYLIPYTNPPRNLSGGCFLIYNPELLLCIISKSLALMSTFMIITKSWVMTPRTRFSFQSFHVPAPRFAYSAGKLKLAELPLATR